MLILRRYFIKKRNLDFPCIFWYTLNLTLGMFVNSTHFMLISGAFCYLERLLASQNPLAQADKPHQLFADAPPTQMNAYDPAMMMTGGMPPPPTMPPPGTVSFLFHATSLQRRSHLCPLSCYRSLW